MKTTQFISAISMAALLSTSAIGATTSEHAKDMSDNSYVTISGTVDSVQNEREFTVRDKTGTISIDVAPNQSIVLEKGQSVTVSGTIDNDMGLVDVDAKDIYVHKGFTKNIGDAIKAVPGVSTTDAQAFNIKDLPAKGMVKVTGIVTDIDSEKEFTIKDSSGTINVDVESSQNAALTEGAKVTVIGSVDSGVLGKDISAKRVIVLADAKTAY